MERLTTYDGGGSPELAACIKCGAGCGNNNENCGMCEEPVKANELLAAYEDTGKTPKELHELLNALKTLV